MSVVADSAINRNRLPVFIPDFAREGWVMELLPAIRIARLGKFIAPQFAHRYIEGITLCALLRPADRMDGAIFFDCALTVGEVKPFELSEPVRIAAKCEPLKGKTDNGQLHPKDNQLIEVAREIAVNLSDINELIARASAYCTLKSGDIVIPGFVGLTFPVLLNHSLIGTVNEDEVLATRLK